MLPALIGQLVVILKDSALGYTITYLELLTWSKTLGSAFANTLPAYLVAAALFILINYSLTLLARGPAAAVPPRPQPADRDSGARPGRDHRSHGTDTD